MSPRRANLSTVVKGVAGVAIITLLAWRDLPHVPLIGMGTAIGLAFVYVMAVLILTMRPRRAKVEAARSDNA